MPAFLNPFSFFPACLSGWLNQHQQIVIDYLTGGSLNYYYRDAA